MTITRRGLLGFIGAVPALAGAAIVGVTGLKRKERDDLDAVRRKIYSTALQFSSINSVKFVKYGSGNGTIKIKRPTFSVRDGNV